MHILRDLAVTGLLQGGAWCATMQDVAAPHVVDLGETGAELRAWFEHASGSPRAILLSPV